MRNLILILLLAACSKPTEQVTPTPRPDQIVTIVTGSSGPPYTIYINGIRRYIRPEPFMDTLAVNDSVTVKLTMSNIQSPWDSCWVKISSNGYLLAQKTSGYNVGWVALTHIYK